MGLEKLSVLVPVFNEEANLAACLESVREVAAEIFVVDSFSTDRTLEIAAQYGARVAQHAYLNSAAQKNWAIPQCAHNWVFIIDADERMTGELRAEIKDLLAKPSGPELDGYFVVRRNFFLGREIKHGGWESNDVQRLFRREMGRYAERDVHADVAVQRADGTPGRSGRLRAKLDHSTCPPDGLNRYFQRFNRYTTQAAERYHREGRRPRILNFFFHPGWEFFKMYVLKLGFLDGIPGLAVCGFCAFTRFVRYVKLYARLVQGLPPPQAYDRGTTASRQIDGAVSGNAGILPASGSAGFQPAPKNNGAVSGDTIPIAAQSGHVPGNSSGSAGFQPATKNKRASTSSDEEPQ